MKIHFEYTGLLHIENVKNKCVLDVEEGTTVAKLLDNLNIRKEHQRYISCFINGSEKRLSTVLHDSDKLKLFLPTGGG